MNERFDITSSGGSGYINRREVQCGVKIRTEADHQPPEVCHLAQIGERPGFKVSSEWDAKSVPITKTVYDDAAMSRVVGFVNLLGGEQ